MEAEEERNKGRSAHRLLDGKVLLKQNGRIGETGAGFLTSPENWPVCVCVADLKVDCLHRNSENSTQTAENTQHTADSVHQPLGMCW